MTKFEFFRRSLWLTLKRTRVSSVSRRQLRLFGFWIAYLIGYGFLLRNEGREAGPWGYAFSVVLLVLALAVGAFIRRHNEHFGDSLLKLSAHESPAAGDLRQHAAIIAKLLLRTAVIVDRAGGEALYLQQKATPELAGTCRRRTLDLARRPGVWEQYTGEEQELLLSQEGSWTREQLWPRVLQADDVRVMRWTLKMDEVLTPFEFLESDVTPAIQTTVAAESIPENSCLESFDLRPAQTMAETMLIRCLGEGIRREFFTLDEPERTQYLSLADRMAADESQDLLVGSETVGKADKERIRWVAEAALRRYLVLTSLITYLNGPAEADLRLPPSGHS